MGKFKKTKTNNKQRSKTKHSKPKKKGKKTVRNVRSKCKMVISGGNKDGFIPLRCNPVSKVKKGGSMTFSCFSAGQIEILKNSWNELNPDDKINDTVSKDIWNGLYEKNKSSCNKESCWISKLIHTPELQKEMRDAFAPLAPKEWEKNPNMWITNFDINRVMAQYEKAYHCFSFLEPAPIDYDFIEDGECIEPELCNFKIGNYIKKGKKKIGIIFNTDVHSGTGEHWVSLFINIPKSKIFYFDSVGDAIPSQIKKFVDKVVDQGAQLNDPIHFEFDQNHPVEHQTKNTECGIYSMYFIVYMLKDEITGDYLKTHILSDKYMEKFRKVLFNEEL
jgi:hypothetical protein